MTETRDGTRENLMATSHISVQVHRGIEVWRPEDEAV